MQYNVMEVTLSSQLSNLIVSHRELKNTNEKQIILSIVFVMTAEVEKVKSVSGNLRIGPKTFCKNEGVRHKKKHAFCPQMDFMAT